jgi:hypothetical protein
MKRYNRSSVTGGVSVSFFDNFFSVPDYLNLIENLKKIKKRKKIIKK